MYGIFCSVADRLLVLDQVKCYAKEDFKNVKLSRLGLNDSMYVLLSNYVCVCVNTKLFTHRRFYFFYPGLSTSCNLSDACRNRPSFCLCPPFIINVTYHPHRLPATNWVQHWLTTALPGGQWTASTGHPSIATNTTFTWLGTASSRGRLQQ